MALERPEVEAMVGRFVARLRNRVVVDEVWVYGSYANGTAGDHSDIDVAVLSPDLGGDRWSDARVFAEAVLPDAILIEAIGFPRDHRESPPRGSLLREVLRTGWRVI